MNLQAKQFTEFDPSFLKLGYGKEVDFLHLNLNQLKELQNYINWKLNDDLNWWEEWGVKGRVDVRVDKMIEDKDFWIFEYEHDGTTYYEVQSDCDRYRFCGTFIFNKEMTKFSFKEV